jgi:hypothetical protein
MSKSTSLRDATAGRIASAFAPSLALAALALAGCNSVQKATDYLASPKTAQAAQNLKNLAQAFDCGVVVTGAALSGQIAEIVDAGQATIGTTGKVYAVSAAVCTALGGTPSAGKVTVR